MHDLEDARAERLFEAEEGLPAILWVVLIVGGIDVVGSTYLFGSESTSVHVLIVASLTLIIALVFFTVAALDYPSRATYASVRRPSNRCWEVREQQARRPLRTKTLQ